MIRTQIYLTNKQHTVLRKKAAESNSTLSEEIRNIIDAEISEKEQDKKRKNTGDWLLSMAAEAEERDESGPTDLAENLDHYLYGK